MTDIGTYPYIGHPFLELPLDRLQIEDAKPTFFDTATAIAFLHATFAWAYPVHFTPTKTGLRVSELFPAQHLVSLPWGSRPGHTWQRPGRTPTFACDPAFARIGRRPGLRLVILRRMRAGRSLDMLKIRPAPQAARQAFGKQLPKGQRPLFDQLARLVE
jgi:hypothetical protein